MRSTPFIGWCVPAAAARSGRCGRCGLTAVDRGQLSWRTGTEPIYRPPAATGCRGGGFLCGLRRREWGSAGGRRKLCCGGVIPSPGRCLRANVNDGTYVRCRSEVPVIVRFG